MSTIQTAIRPAQRSRGAGAAAGSWRQVTASPRYFPAGTWLATNLPATNAVNPELLASQRDESKRLRTAAAHVLDAEIPDLEDLWYPEERTDLAAWLGEHGWDASAIGMADLLARYGRDVPGDNVRPPVDFVSARRS